MQQRHLVGERVDSSVLCFGYHMLVHVDNLAYVVNAGPSIRHVRPVRVHRPSQNMDTKSFSIAGLVIRVHTTALRER